MMDRGWRFQTDFLMQHSCVSIREDVRSMPMLSDDSFFFFFNTFLVDVTCCEIK